VLTHHYIFMYVLNTSGWQTLKIGYCAEGGRGRIKNMVLEWRKGRGVCVLKMVQTDLPPHQNLTPNTCGRFRPSPLLNVISQIRPLATRLYKVSLRLWHFSTPYAAHHARTVFTCGLLLECAVSCMPCPVPVSMSIRQPTEKMSDGGTQPLSRTGHEINFTFSFLT